MQNLCILESMTSNLLCTLITRIILVTGASARSAAVRVAALAMPGQYGAQASLGILEQGGS
jgi:hypothetical protein